MKLWELRPCEGLPEKDNPWDPWYDKAFGMIVRAETEEEARKLANAAGGDEIGEIRHQVYRTGGNPWLNPAYTTCVELRPEGDAEVVMVDFHAA